MVLCRREQNTSIIYQILKICWLGIKCSELTGWLSCAVYTIPWTAAHNGLLDVEINYMYVSNLVPRRYSSFRVAARERADGRLKILTYCEGGSLFVILLWVLFRRCY